MNKTILLLLIAFCSIALLNAQEKLGPISIKYGQEIKQDSEKIVRIAGEANGKVYTLATKGKKYFVKIFSADEMALLSTEEIVLPDFKDKEPEFESIAVLDDKAYILGSIYDRKNKESDLVAIEIAENGKVVGEGKILFSTKITKKKEKGAFYFRKSPNEDKLLILHAALFEKEEVMQYEVKLINKDLEIVQSSLQKIPFKDRKGLEFTIADFDVSAKDDVFLVVNESYRDKKAKQNVEKFQVHMFKQSANYTKEVVDIDLTGSEVINCEMLANRQNKLQLVGFYSSVRANGKANKELKGVYAVTVDIDTKTVEQSKLNPFDYETKVKLIGERRAKKGKDVKPLYETHSLIEKEDGGLFLLTEYHYVTIGKKQGIGPLAMQPITHVNNEIIVTCLKPDGTVAWSNVIAKKQQAAFTAFSVGFYAFAQGNGFSVSGGISVPIGVAGKGPEYLSAMPIYKNDQLTVVFNDNPKNKGITDIEEIKRMVNYNKSVPTAFVFDEQGKITRIDEELHEKEQLILRPGVFYRKKPSEYIIYSSKKSKDKLGRMIID